MARCCDDKFGHRPGVGKDRRERDSQGEKTLDLRANIGFTRGPFTRGSCPIQIQHWLPFGIVNRMVVYSASEANHPMFCDPNHHWGCPAV
jgi:hypothetical protein